MAWAWLLAAGVVEVAFALSVPPTDGFTRAWPTVRCVVLGAVAVYLLSTAARSLPIGTAYAVFTAIGAAGTVVAGIVLFGDPATPGRILPLVLIAAGVVALRFLSPA